MAGQLEHLWLAEVARLLQAALVARQQQVAKQAVLLKPATQAAGLGELLLAAGEAAEPQAMEGAGPHSESLELEWQLAVPQKAVTELLALWVEQAQLLQVEKPLLEAVRVEQPWQARAALELSV